MIILVILLAVIGLGIWMMTTDYDIGGLLIIIISGIYLLVHVIIWSTSSYEYNKFVVKRQSFVETLKEARKNVNNYELASLSREVSQWNSNLAVTKYQNKLFFLGDYIDDRFENLESIK